MRARCSCELSLTAIMMMRTLQLDTTIVAPLRRSDPLRQHPLPLPLPLRRSPTPASAPLCKVISVTLSACRINLAGSLPRSLGLCHVACEVHSVRLHGVLACACANLPLRTDHLCAPAFFGADVEVVNPAESARSYSSVHNNDAVGTGHARSMLDSAQAWSAQTNSAQAWSAGLNMPGQYMTISLGSVQTVTGVVTQGRPQGNQFVTSYKVQTSPDCSVYSDVDGGRVFSGNVEMYSKVPNFFSAAVQASCVRLLPQSWVNHMSMRAGVVVSGGPVSSLPLAQ